MTEHLARIKKGGETFEIVIDPDKAMDFKKNGGNVEDALIFPKVFSDAKKGLEASQDRMQALFNTSDALAVATLILQDGEIQVSAEYRQKMRDQKYNQIVTWIQRHSMDPRAKLPIPRTRIEAAIDEAKVRIDENKTAEQQVESIVDKLKVVMPIIVATKQLKVVIPGDHAAKSYQLLHSYKVLKETWDGSGNWCGTIEIPAGIELEFYDKINALTQGNNTIDVIQ
jgi:ribosome maturation protein SDO1